MPNQKSEDPQLTMLLLDQLLMAGMDLGRDIGIFVFRRTPSQSRMLT